MAIIYGMNPVLEALESGVVKRIVVARGRAGEGLHKLRKLAEQKGIDIEFRERDYLDRLTGKAVHQGVLCVGPEFSYVTVEEIVEHRIEPYEHHLILILDSVIDPQNLGSLIRTASCFGANGLIIPENRAASVTPAVVKSSAGATQHARIARVVNIAHTIDSLKDRGFWIYGAEAGSGEEIPRVGYHGHVGLVMGSEGKGIRPLVKKKCDFLISVPIEGKVGSLNVAVAAGIILFDIFTKRNRRPQG
jgi:23S rRNA (guanosine2251-2'-O)-methyltransferase